MSDRARPGDNQPAKTRHGSEKRLRGDWVKFRVTPEEKLVVDAKAQHAGLTAASYARSLALNAPPVRAVRRPPVEVEALSRLLGLSGRATGSIHQIAKRVNFGEAVEAAEIRAAVAEVREAALAIMQMLGRRQP
jgi:hypothetical protein